MTFGEWYTPTAHNFEDYGMMLGEELTEALRQLLEAAYSAGYTQGCKDAAINQLQLQQYTKTLFGSTV